MELDTLANSFLWLPYGVISILLLAGVSLYYKPSWVKDDSRLNKNWLKIVIISGSLSLLFAGFLKLLGNVSGIYIAMVSVYSFIMIQSIPTDFLVRKVDRFVMRAAIVLSFPLSLVAVLAENIQVHTLTYIILLLFSAGTVFIGKWGASDARALFLTSLTLYPLLGFSGLEKWLLLVAAAVVSYASIVSFRNRNFSGFFTKLSLPMVPLMMLPASLLLLWEPFASFINF